MTDQLAAEMRAAISNAYYDSRHEGRTMEDAADRAVRDALATPAMAALLREAENLRVRLGIIRHLVANYLYNEDGENEEWLEVAYETAVDAIGHEPDGYDLAAARAALNEGGET